MHRILPAAIYGLTWLTALSSSPPPQARAQTPSAEYTARFDATWSAQTHPSNFPPGPHFSGLIGGTHNDAVSFWQVGGLASPGIKNMSELGAKQPLRSEVESAIAQGTAGEVISGGGIGLSPGSVAVSFTVTPEHPLVTLVSMIAPSPDWFVGISGLSLLEDGDWVGERVVVLWPHDAGTDSGAIYVSPNQVTVPPQPVSRLTTNPFDNQTPLGTLTLTRTDPPPAPPLPALELHDGRFEVTLEWNAKNGGGGAGSPVPLTRDTGYFWFFDPDNVEVVVKVLDACSSADRFWVFAGGLTNVGVTLTIEDTETGESRDYTNPSGTPFEPIQDTQAFATCP